MGIWGRTFIRLVLALTLGAAAVAVDVSPAGAIHLFPVTPDFDPLGHDCAKALKEGPTTAVGNVAVAGFSFVDSASGTAKTTVAAGESVTWTWLADHCHSVTFDDGSGTFGANGFMPAGQPELVRFGSDGGDSFTKTFETPGAYVYRCVHHASVGMVGTVEVSALS